MDINEGYLTWTNEIYYEEGKQKYGRFDMQPTFQDSTYLCVSKNVFYRKNVKQSHDIISLNSSLLYDGWLYLDVYVHQRGKLLRTLMMDGLRTRFGWNENMLQGVSRIFHIGQVDVLRKRKDGKFPCDPAIENEDDYKLEQVIKKVGCIPTFWEQFAGRVGIQHTLPKCKNTTDYFKLLDQLWGSFTSFKTNDANNKSPCTTMMTSITTTSGNANFIAEGTLRLKLEYHHNLYREILNKRAYTSETLLGQVGGFVGK